VSLSLVTDDTVLPHRAEGLPDLFRRLMTFDASGRCVRVWICGCALVIRPLRRSHGSSACSVYYPVVSFNEFWELRADYAPVANACARAATLPLRVSFAPVSLFRWQLEVQLSESLALHESWGTQTTADQDGFKRMLRDTAPWLLALTFAVTALHSVFDMLAY
jgi:hypothetical protein